MAVDVFGLLALLSATIILGYIGIYIFDRTKIPDIIWLMLFGFLVGPGLGLVDTSVFFFISPILTTVAIILILFDAGLHLDIYETIRTFPRAFLFSIVGMVVTMVAIAAASMLLFEFDLYRGLLMGAILGGISGAIVIPIADQMRVSHETKNIMKLESVMTDPLVIVISIALISMIAAGAAATEIQKAIASAYSVGAVVGFLSGLIWNSVLVKLKGKQFDYMLTLAALLIVYVIAENTGGSGAIAALMFGLVLGNSATLSRMLKLKHVMKLDPMLKTFQSEITFFIRSFFFVFMGIVATMNMTYALFGVVIALLIIAVRPAVVTMSTTGMKVEKEEFKMMSIMVPRGLAAAVLAQIPKNVGIPGGDIFINIAFAVIFASVIYTTIAFKKYYVPTVPEEEKKEKPPEKPAPKIKVEVEKPKRRRRRTIRRRRKK